MMQQALLGSAQWAAQNSEPDMIDMSPSLILVLAVGAFVTAGVYLLLERSLTRVLLGFILIGNGVNIMFLIAGGRAGGAPIIGLTDEADMSDPLPQAMVLTAIVITLGLTAFVAAMAYRSWQIHGHDEVQDDLEDRRIARLAAKNLPTVTDADASDMESNVEDDASEVRDETTDRSQRDTRYPHAALMGDVVLEHPQAGQDFDEQNPDSDDDDSDADELDDEALNPEHPRSQRNTKRGEDHDE